MVFTHNQLAGIIRYDLSNFQATNLRLYHFSSDLIYALDVLYATMGYCLSLRVFDAHLRSAEPTMFGWVVALECYQPFWGKLSSPLYLHYDGIGFETWLSDHLNLRWAWAAVILAFEGIYLLATFSFGVRFSNLTHRGILTNGPYRFTKHPAYVAKNLLVVDDYFARSFRTTAGSMCDQEHARPRRRERGVLSMRARTEERHLSRDPTYVAYAKWIDAHGMLRFLNRLPILRLSGAEAADR